MLGPGSVGLTWFSRVFELDRGQLRLGHDEVDSVDTPRRRHSASSRLGSTPVAASCSMVAKRTTSSVGGCSNLASRYLSSCAATAAQMFSKPPQRASGSCHQDPPASSRRPARRCRLLGLRRVHQRQLRAAPDPIAGRCRRAARRPRPPVRASRAGAQHRPDPPSYGSEPATRRLGGSRGTGR